MDTISGDAEKIVICKMVKPKSMRTLAACKLCQHHRGIEELRPEGQLGLPASYMVYCGLPSKELVIDLIREGI